MNVELLVLQIMTLQGDQRWSVMLEIFLQHTNIMVWRGD